jgi:hypothetical protein
MITDVFEVENHEFQGLDHRYLATAAEKCNPGDLTEALTIRFYPD